MAENIQTSINTEQVSSVADQMKSDNDKLLELLDATKTAIIHLTDTNFTGPAADATKNSYEQFSGKFQQYYDVIDQYVKYLRRNVVEGYTETERANGEGGLADTFK